MPPKQTTHSKNDGAHRRTTDPYAGFDHRVPGILAIICLIGSFVLAGIQQAQTGNADIPAWAAGVVGSIVGFYFGGARHRPVIGVAAIMVATMVNVAGVFR